ncbi:MAG: LytTR family DNA-binding domain-containing protein [Pseudomonadota bacterium]
MNLVIVDDERLARNELRRLLGAHEDVCVVGEAACVADGIRAVERMEPDLVLLDVQMPDGSGFDLLTALATPPAVIFTTAHDQHAVRAFQVSALDYLLKPIEAELLAQALDKQRRRMALAPEPSRTAAEGRIFIQDGERCWLVELDRIMLFESEGNYTRLYFDGQRPLLLRSLVQLEARLEPSRFLRVSRSRIVNMDFVEGIKPSPGGGLTLLLQDGLQVPMSRRRSVLFRQSAQL